MRHNAGVNDETATESMPGARANHKRRALVGCGALVAALACVLLGGWVWYRHRAQPAPERRALFEGVTYIRDVRRSPRPMVVHVVRVDLSAPGVELLVTPGDPAQQKPLRARLTSQFLREFGCQVAVNGDFFFPWRSNSPFDYYPHVGDPVELEGYAWSRGTQYSQGGERWKYPVLYLSKDNRASFERPTWPVWNAISGDWLFLHDGRAVVVAPTDEYHATPQPRTAVALDRARRTLLLVVVDGRQPGYSEGATIPELAAIVRQYGGWDALNLDGGGSSTLAAQGPDGEPEVLNCPIDCHIPGRERPVANHLGVFARPLPASR